MSNPLATRTRNTVATATRNANLRDVLAALETGPMLFSEVCTVLGFSASGTRKYCLDLLHAGVVVVSTRTTSYANKSDVRYSLSGNAEKMTTFRAMLDRGEAPEFQRSARAIKNAAARDALMPSGRHVYTQGEDLERLIARKVKIPAPDPLLALFYNMAA